MRNEFSAIPWPYCNGLVDLRSQRWNPHEWKTAWSGDWLWHWVYSKLKLENLPILPNLLQLPNPAKLNPLNVFLLKFIYFILFWNIWHILSSVSGFGVKSKLLSKIRQIRQLRQDILENLNWISRIESTYRIHMNRTTEINCLEWRFAPTLSLFYTKDANKKQSTESPICRSTRKTNLDIVRENSPRLDHLWMNSEQSDRDKCFHSMNSPNCGFGSMQ